MQEESGAKASSFSNGTAAWLCPLCQKSQEDRGSLSQHLTEQHSVLPTCVDKLLDISVLKQGVREEVDEGALISSVAVCTQERTSKDICSELCDPSSEVPLRHKEEMDENRVLDQEGGEAEPEPEDGIIGGEQTAAEYEESKNVGPAENNAWFNCNACLETFPSRTALGVHYYSASHIQRMTTIQGREIDPPPSPSPSVLSRPYVSNKPYQCGICRVSYNHSITLESHLKSVLHQTRSRNAVNSFALGSCGSSNSSPPNTTVSTSISGTGELAITTNCATLGSMMVTTARNAEHLQTSPVASAQAVSAFLTLLTSSPSTLSHPLLPSLFATSHPTGSDPTQIVPQPHMVMPLILNGIQAQQTQQSGENQQGQLLTQCVPFVGLNTAQQALLTQRLSLLQNQWPPVALPTNTAENVKQDSIEKHSDQIGERESIKRDKPDEESCPNTESTLQVESNDVWKVPNDSSTMAHQMDVENDKSVSTGFSPIVMEKSLHNLSSLSMPSNPSYSPVHLNLTLSPDSTPQKSQAATSPCASIGTSKSSPFSSVLSTQYRLHCNTMGSMYPESPVLSEFQSEVLWAFFESRSEAHAASPLREDCEALGREVGLSEEEVRKWLCQARYGKRKERDTELTHQQCSSGFAKTTPSSDNDFDDDENSLIIAEEEEDADVSGNQVIDLSRTRRLHRQRGVGREGQGDSCLTSDSENEVYTSVIVTDEESQNGGFRESPEIPARGEVQLEVHCDKDSVGGKVLRSTTVFLSDVEDEYEEEDGGGVQRSVNKKRKGEFEHEVEVKKERMDPDVDLELEAQADPPNSLPYSLDQVPSGGLHSLPLSLAPFSAQFLSPYVLSLTPSLVGSKIPVFSNPPSITRFPCSLLSQSPSSMNQSSQSLSNGSNCETALDLSMGKNNSSSSLADTISAQKGQLLDGLGLRPTSQSLVVVQVKPESHTTMPSSYRRMDVVNSNNLTKSSIYTRPDEKMNVTLCDSDKEREKEKDQQQRKAKGKRYRDMRRSRTIIQAEQLDILYGCYFKDPNPGKHEFEQISEWVQLPKKVVQIWFQNMRARERKGEVRFISDGTLAAVGKPLIKFTWPLSKPIFSNKPIPNNTGCITTAPIVRTLIKTESKHVVVKKNTPVPIKPKEVVSDISVGSSSASAMPKTKLETTSSVPMVKVASSIVPTILTSPKDLVPIAPRLKQQKNVDDESEEDKTDEDIDDENETAPRMTNRMVPKLPTTPINNRPPSTTVLPQKLNGLNYWTPKVPIRINTLSREELALPAHVPPRTIPPPPTPSIAPVSPSTPNLAKVARSSTPVLGKSSPTENSFLAHSSSRRPRTHLSCLQLSILQSCYETCAHPNAMECEAIGAELNLPLKVVQIWFQNTRAKEKRWRLQQEKMGSQAGGGKVFMTSGSYLQYNALKANRPILPKPVQLTITESPTSPATGHASPNETLTGCCEVCKVSFESRAAARAHVFSSLHLAKLRTTNFGQPTALNRNETGNRGSGGVNLSLQVCQSSSTGTGSSASSGGIVVIELPPSAATSNS
ncbi:zinc finger homeobox protein 4 isoform X2 [Syngnathoides biaculeatus]|uniref:zinc finger homeobox protein 4 isoform X2 n=1 Tax=Syngnathoides biaculeatus TaxID=300417 RepID=UPI002ADD6CA6|nr:zinc finger homeobox protein 4 isoform X2 [Syngnathoides biaculeatus]